MPHWMVAGMPHRMFAAREARLRLPERPLLAPLAPRRKQGFVTEYQISVMGDGPRVRKQCVPTRMELGFEGGDFRWNGASLGVKG